MLRIAALKEYNTNVTVYDPWANTDEVKNEDGLDTIEKPPISSFDAIVLAVSHDEFGDLNFDVLKNQKAIVYDIKNFLPDSIKNKGL